MPLTTKRTWTASNHFITQSFEVLLPYNSIQSFSESRIHATGSFNTPTSFVTRAFKLATFARRPKPVESETKQHGSCKRSLPFHFFCLLSSLCENAIQWRSNCRSCSAHANLFSCSHCLPLTPASLPRCSASSPLPLMKQLGPRVKIRTARVPPHPRLHFKWQKQAAERCQVQKCKQQQQKLLRKKK